MKRLNFLTYSALVGAFLAGAGCKSSSKMRPTPSGLPEVSLRAKTGDEVKVVAGKFFISRGYVETRSEHLYEMVYDKPNKISQSRRALRVRLRLHKETDGLWRLIGTPAGVDGWRTNLETEIVLSEGASQIQGFLVEIKNQVESTGK
jgi:hypothetical protein